ncbi:RRP12-like protein [Phlebotomus argentipes]|uniref:RRP12-like protein n=1 Tax=Phlebotomus argentipes TaxID=94469 RepID=UPI002892DD95|nr:RRP12-like protein [Phlebotomus argentipes]
MGKFRSKLKSHSKGKRWASGHSAVTNPENFKHRSKAKSRFFQPNLSLAPKDAAQSGLTLNAVMQHEAREMYASGQADPTVKDIALSMKSVSLDDMMTESAGKTFKTFASNYTDCTNVSFSKLLTRFRADSSQHKDMLAVLAAITDVINDKNGTQSSTEYFIALLEVLGTVKEDNHMTAALSLLAMGIKSVPQAVLRKKFSETGELLFNIMHEFAEKEDQSVWRNVLGCMSVLLRSQEYALWTLSSTTKYFESVLAFTIHSRAKIRKAAQHGVTSIMMGSHFMVESETAVHAHPASGIVRKFCVMQFNSEKVSNSQTLVLHTLGLLQGVIGVLKEEDVKVICENILSIMTASNILVRTTGFQTLHALFASKLPNASAELTGKLISALYEYRPDRLDVRQTIVWVTVLKEGLLSLGRKDLSLCSKALPRFVDICTSDLWMSEKLEIVSATSNALKEVLQDCVQPCCETAQEATRHAGSLQKVIKSISKALTGSPFGHVAKQVFVILKATFDACGNHLGDALQDTVATVGRLYDTESAVRVQIEHCLVSAIDKMGPERILKAIPLTEDNGVVSLNRSWILPLLRESIRHSSLSFFINHILSLADQCRNKWRKYEEEKNTPVAHTYELLCCQLWGLFPGFCRQPIDPENFQSVARTLGSVLTNNPELRTPVLDGLKELCTNPTDACKKELERFAKNFMPIFFNIYTTKPATTYAAEQRELTLEVIQMYLEVTPEAVREQLYEKALEQLKDNAPGKFTSESLFALVRILALYMNEEKLSVLYDKFVSPILERKKKNAIVVKEEDRIGQQQKKTYKFLETILRSENQGCRDFVAKRKTDIRDMLLSTFSKTTAQCQGSRLTCLSVMFEHAKKLNSESMLVKKTIPELILAYGSFHGTKDTVADDLLRRIADLHEKDDKLNDMIDSLSAGLAGDQVLVTNTILALKFLFQHFAENLRVTTIEFVLQQILSYSTGKQRPIVASCVGFLLVFVRVIPVPLVANHLTVIIKNLSGMVPDTKRYCRKQLGFLYRRLCRRFTAEEIIKLVPGNDEVTHKRLKNIKKEQARKKRQEAEKGHQKGDSDEEAEEEMLERKIDTIDDVLADSDEEFDEEEKEEKPQKKSRKAKESFIKEDAETIVDLADVNAIGKITTSRPQTETVLVKRPKEANRGFKVASDGRLVIEEPKRGHAAEEESDDEEDAEERPSKKNRLMEDSSSDEELVETAPKSRKRKAEDALSAASGHTGYRPGGRGIHRALSAYSGQSGKTSMSRVSKASTKTSGATFGQEYKAKKGRGDVKKKGKFDPYAYIPLDKSTLNKRKRAKSAGQFKSIVKGARKGAAAGSKNRLVKK